MAERENYLVGENVDELLAAAHIDSFPVSVTQEPTHILLGGVTVEQLPLSVAMSPEATRLAIGSTVLSSNIGESDSGVNGLVRVDDGLVESVNEVGQRVHDAITAEAQAAMPADFEAEMREAGLVQGDSALLSAEEQEGLSIDARYDLRGDADPSIVISEGAVEYGAEGQLQYLSTPLGEMVVGSVIARAELFEEGDRFTPEAVSGSPLVQPIGELATAGTLVTLLAQQQPEHDLGELNFTEDQTMTLESDSTPEQPDVLRHEAINVPAAEVVDGRSRIIELLGEVGVTATSASTGNEYDAVDELDPDLDTQTSNLIYDAILVIEAEAATAYEQIEKMRLYALAA